MSVNPHLNFVLIMKTLYIVIIHSFQAAKFYYPLDQKFWVNAFCSVSVTEIFFTVSIHLSFNFIKLFFVLHIATYWQFKKNLIFACIMYLHGMREKQGRNVLTFLEKGFLRQGWQHLPGSSDTDESVFSSDLAYTK